MKISKFMSFVSYLFIALILKLSSIYPNFYRLIGNQLGAKRRVRHGIPNSYGMRAKQFLSWYQKYKMIQEGDTVLELGTGWVHFESIIIRLFYNVRIILFDVWDNRQLSVLKEYAVNLENLLYREIDLTDSQKQRIRTIIGIISNSNSFEELYKHLNFLYKVDPAGTLKSFQNDSFQLVCSHNVLEHIDKKIVPDLINDIYRVLSPGGYSCHDIDLTDHLVSFGRIQNLHKKYYLRFSDNSWTLFFENKVQYINRIQCSEWLNYFKHSGLELVESEIINGGIDSTIISNAYNQLSKQDLQCIRLRVIHKKPLFGDF